MKPTSEELHGIHKQPPGTCELIDLLMGKIDKCQRLLRNYEREDSDFHKEILKQIKENLISISEYGERGLLDAIRSRCGQIRVWGEGWKRYALKKGGSEDER